MAEIDTIVVPQGPGAIRARGHDWEPALVHLELEYAHNGEPNSTRAVLNLIAHDFEDREHPVTITQIELTAYDLIVLVGVASAMHQAAREDDRG